MKDLLPPLVFEAVSKHLRQCGRRAHQKWASNQAHEDSLTGAVFADLQTSRKRRINVNGQDWTWQVTTRKFGSGGKNSEEKLTGADGIIEIEIRHGVTGQIEGKGLLVQAKKQWTGKNNKLFEQVGDMERLASGSSAAIDYSAKGYTGVDGKSVLAADGDRQQVEDATDLSLGDFLVDRFLACKVGLRGLHYEARRRMLYLPSTAGRPQAVEFFISERLRIEIEEINRA